jgi:hypothetical protein
MIQNNSFDENSLLNKNRLSDRIVYALALAIQQEDVRVANALAESLDLSMTRYTGGGEFVERREYPKYIEEIMENLEKLRAQYGYK